jgi:hypothetical protein
VVRLNDRIRVEGSRSARGPFSNSSTAKGGAIVQKGRKFGDYPVLTSLSYSSSSGKMYHNIICLPGFSPKVWYFQFRRKTVEE